MGKVLGGGSSINVMARARGHKSDWDFFAEEAGDLAWATNRCWRFIIASRTVTESPTRNIEAQVDRPLSNRHPIQIRSLRLWS